MFEVYEYEGLMYEEVCARYVKRAAGGSRILGPELTDKFEMWRVTGGESVTLLRSRAVAVVTDGAGEVNGLAVTKGDRLLIADDRDIVVQGAVTLVVCA